MRIPASLLVLALLVTTAEATTYVVPDDRYLISAADGIITGTVRGAHVRRGENGTIETVTEIAVEEWIKGEGTVGLAVVHPGGQIGGERLTVPGVPSFAPGERVLLFLDRTRGGDWTTWAFALGAFRLDATGFVTRGGDDIFGWTVDGARHVERPRRRDEFVAYVRAIAHGEYARAEYFGERPAAAAGRVQVDATFSSGSYSWPAGSRPLRRNALQVVWRLSGNPGDLDLVEAVDAGIAAWNATSPRIAYSRSAAPASDDRQREDSEARIIANDPHDDVPDHCCVGILAYTFWHDRGTHSFNGQTFATISDTDIVLNDNMSSTTFSQASLNEVVAHELGHTLGLRHSDKNPANDAPCGAGFNCCVHTDDGGNCPAVMNSSLLYKDPGLETWDRDAIACLYESNCTTTCVAPSFLTKPQGRLLYQGAETLLTAKVRATPPITVQWYAGPSGDTSTPVDANVWLVHARPLTTTDYWVRVTDTCGSIDSDTATITVVRCPGVVITSADATIVAPGQVRLRVIAAGGGSLRYLWFHRNAPDAPEKLIGVAPTLTVAYAEGALFSVRVENRCGKSATSGALTPSTDTPTSRRRRSRH